MFTGIVEGKGTIARLKNTEQGISISVKVPGNFLKGAKKGESIAVNGACLTVSGFKVHGFDATVIPETLHLTNLSLLKKGNTVNLERSLQWNDRISGHFMTGHIDGTAKVISFKKDPARTALIVAVPNPLEHFVTKKGSVALNGVSLTVAKMRKNLCTVALIPETFTRTNLKDAKKGDLLNIEVDLLARYSGQKKGYAGKNDRHSDKKAKPLRRNKARKKKSLPIAIAASSFHKNLVQELIFGVKMALHEQKNYSIKTRLFRTHGSFELPFLVAKLAASGKFSGIIALGIVIRGETDHHKFIERGSTWGMMEAGLKSKVPVTFGVITANTMAQAEARAQHINKKIIRNKKAAYTNKGFEAGSAMGDLLKVIQLAYGS